MSLARWSRTAFAIAIVFGSLPLTARLLLGDWEFQSAGGIACLCAAAGLYFRIRDGRGFWPVPDPAVMLDEANRLAASGRPDRALARLTKAIRLSPRFWQAYQYRGELYLALQRPAEALRDFDNAIALAGDEPHLEALRDQARAAIVKLC